jgi:hypothetical protein
MGVGLLIWWSLLISANLTSFNLPGDQPVTAG